MLKFPTRSTGAGALSLNNMLSQTSMEFLLSKLPPHIVRTGSLHEQYFELQSVFEFLATFFTACSELPLSLLHPGVVACRIRLPAVGRTSQQTLWWNSFWQTTYEDTYRGPPLWYLSALCSETDPLNAMCHGCSSHSWAPQPHLSQQVIWRRSKTAWWCSMSQTYPDWRETA